MNATPKTIQIFLPAGDPHGIRTAEITTRIVQVIEVPRSLLPDFLKMPESDQVALYFLFSQATGGDAPKVYIGQTGDLRARLTKHNATKDFWERAVVLISRTNSLTQTHALFLEWHCIQAARKAGRYADENANSGSKPHTPAPLEADCLEIFDTGRTLLTTLGYPLFDPLTSSAEQESTDVFRCTSAGANARGLLTAEGFVILSGSRGRRESTASLDENNQRFRDELIDSGAVRVEGEEIVFEKDQLFGSPSKAAIAILGRNSNGWIEWKSADGKTLDELRRAGAEADE